MLSVYESDGFGLLMMRGTSEMRIEPLLMAARYSTLESTPSALAVFPGGAVRIDEGIN